MDQKTTQTLKEQLLKRKAEVIASLESIGHQVAGKETNFHADFPQYGDSLEDSAIEVADYATNLSLERDLENELRDTEKALQKIEDGSYGRCEKCGQPIDPARLAARPASSCCVNCRS